MYKTLKISGIIIAILYTIYTLLFILDEGIFWSDYLEQNIFDFLISILFIMSFSIALKMILSYKKIFSKNFLILMRCGITLWLTFMLLLLLYCGEYLSILFYFPLIIILLYTHVNGDNKEHTIKFVGYGKLFKAIAVAVFLIILYQYSLNGRFQDAGNNAVVDTRTGMVYGLEVEDNSIYGTLFPKDYYFYAKPQLEGVPFQ